ncbi:uncharacterized protein M6B38_142545 [Iris pallida]|nr:uncharacterized protein M6B38_142545 [Iris pallida]
MVVQRGSRTVRARRWKASRRGEGFRWCTARCGTPTEVQTGESWGPLILSVSFAFFGCVAVKIAVVSNEVLKNFGGDG